MIVHIILWMKWTLITFCVCSISELDVISCFVWFRSHAFHIFDLQSSNKNIIDWKEVNRLNISTKLCQQHQLILVVKFLSCRFYFVTSFLDTAGQTGKLRFLYDSNWNRTRFYCLVTNGIIPWLITHAP